MKGRDYVIPEDIKSHFIDVCSHRIILHPKAVLSSLEQKKILTEILERNTAPKM